MKDLVDTHFPEATLMSMVLDHQHGSWLHMAEMEFSVLSTQSLDQRLPSQAAVRHTITAWEIRRNAEQIKVNWRFTIPKARRTLKRLYPS
jgi:L-fucose mutarotase/ribose pyranase (RbsD/FucU family)